MNSDEPVPRELKVLDTISLIGLEERACRLGLNQRLEPAWVREHAAPGGTHYLWPALWHGPLARPGVARHLRCELLVEVRTGKRVMSLLDVLPVDFTPLPRVTSRDEGLEVARFVDAAPTVRAWLEGRGAKG